MSHSLRHTSCHACFLAMLFIAPTPSHAVIDPCGAFMASLHDEMVTGSARESVIRALAEPGLEAVQPTESRDFALLLELHQVFEAVVAGNEKAREQIKLNPPGKHQTLSEYLWRLRGEQTVSDPMVLFEIGDPALRKRAVARLVAELRARWPREVGDLLRTARLIAGQRDHKATRAQIVRLSRRYGNFRLSI